MKKRQKAPSTPLSDQYIVFTGKLTVTRKEATFLVEKIGCHVQSSVTRQTTILVLGSQNEKKLREGHDRSLKHDAVKKRISEGQAIKILNQAEFYQLIDYPIQLSLLDLISKPAPKERKVSPVPKITPQQRPTVKKSNIRPDSLDRGDRFCI
jgi:hypothetical protein